MKVEKDESLIDAGKSAVMTMRWRPLADGVVIKCRPNFVFCRYGMEQRTIHTRRRVYGLSIYVGWLMFLAYCHVEKVAFEILNWQLCVLLLSLQVGTFSGKSNTQTHTHYRYVRSLLGERCPAYSGPQRWLRPYSGPVRLPRERKGIGRCVRCVVATCEKGGLSRSEHWAACRVFL